MPAQCVFLVKWWALLRISSIASYPEAVTWRVIAQKEAFQLHGSQHYPPDAATRRAVWLLPVALVDAAKVKGHGTLTSHGEFKWLDSTVSFAYCVY